MYFWHLLALKFMEPDVRRMKRRISRRQFLDWVQFQRVHPIDGDKQRDHLLALAVIFLARQAGDTSLEYDQLIPDPFEPTAEDDMAVIMQAFKASG